MLLSWRSPTPRGRRLIVDEWGPGGCFPVSSPLGLCSRGSWLSASGPQLLRCGVPPLSVRRVHFLRPHIGGGPPFLLPRLWWGWSGSGIVALTALTSALIAAMMQVLACFQMVAMASGRRAGTLSRSVPLKQTNRKMLDIGDIGINWFNFVRDRDYPFG